MKQGRTYSVEEHAVPSWDDEDGHAAHKRRRGDDRNDGATLSSSSESEDEGDSESEDEEDSWAVVGLGHGQKSGHVRFTGSVVPRHIICALGRSGGGKALAQNVIRHARGGLTVTLRQRQVGTRYHQASDGETVTTDTHHSSNTSDDNEDDEDSDEQDEQDAEGDGAAMSTIWSREGNWGAGEGIEPKRHFLYAVQQEDDTPTDVAKQLVSRF